MAENDDFIRADMWASLSFNPKMPDDELIKWFREFSVRADKMLLDDWTKYVEKTNDERMRKICKMLTDVIYEKEHPPVKKMITISVERDSYGMQDNSAAPHCEKLECEEDESLSRFMYEILGYLPAFGHRMVWDIYADATYSDHNNGRKLATLTRNAGSFNYELHVPDDTVKNIGINKIYCAITKIGD